MQNKIAPILISELQLHCDKHFNQFKEFDLEMLKFILPENMVSIEHVLYK